ncbi:hypothetical protein CPC08DRAFT_745942 [Agrocybe pediades]|nr:hypothetical protein CPC08DRAFT_745942 [Agrocybe pediades]
MPLYHSLAWSMNVVHITSFIFALVVLALSFPDCGILSFCMNPILALITGGYNVTMLLLAYKRPADAPVLSVAYTIMAYLLSLAWLAAYTTMAVLLSCPKKDVILFGFQVVVPQAVKTTQKLQIMLDPVLFVLMGNVAIKSTLERRHRCSEHTKSMASEGDPDC